MTSYSDLPKPNLPMGESKLPVRSKTEINELIDEATSIASENEINEERCSSEKDDNDTTCK